MSNNNNNINNNDHVPPPQAAAPAVTEDGTNQLVVDSSHGIDDHLPPPGTENDHLHDEVNVESLEQPSLTTIENDVSAAVQMDLAATATSTDNGGVIDENRATNNNDAAADPIGDMTKDNNEEVQNPPSFNTSTTTTTTTINTSDANDVAMVQTVATAQPSTNEGGIPLPPLNVPIDHHHPTNHVYPTPPVAQPPQQRVQVVQQIQNPSPTETNTQQQPSTNTNTTAENNNTNEENNTHDNTTTTPMVPQDPSFGFSYFAIRCGKYGIRSSIFLNWKDCEKFIDGYDRAEYASFEKFEEAVTYLLGGGGGGGGGEGTNGDDDAQDENEVEGGDLEEDEMMVEDQDGGNNISKKRKLEQGGDNGDKNVSLISPFTNQHHNRNTSTATTASNAYYTGMNSINTPHNPTNHLLTGHRRGVRVKAEANPNRKPTKAWEKMYQRYADYIQKKGSTDVDATKESADLLRWTRQQQHEYRYLKEGKASSMFQVKIEKLRAIGFEFKYVSVRFVVFFFMLSSMFLCTVNAYVMNS